MVMTNGMAMILVNKPIVMNNAQKNSAKMTSKRDVVDPIPKKL